MNKTILLAIIFYLAAVSINFAGSRIYPAVLRDSVRIVPDSGLMDLLCLDHRGFAADCLFAGVIIHSGSLMWKPMEFGFDSEWSFKTMDLVTDLDPKYFTAYLFSGMGLIHSFDDAELAKPILEKGIKNLPERWELLFWLGYDHYAYLEDYETAAKFLLEAAQKPGAPGRFLALLLTAAQRGGEYQAAQWALLNIMKTTKDETTRKIYRKKLDQIENLILLQQASGNFRITHNRSPNRLDELVAGGFIKNIPQDPIGMTYKWDPEKLRVVTKKIKQPRP
ncbi:MAG: hypothetical protein KAI35_08525 [Desulfobulbaceae bacterium]|nr:hypothetical protein [Desulfobulbaceae bacterium]